MKTIRKILLIVLILQFVFALQSVSAASWWQDLFTSADNFIDTGTQLAEQGKLTTGDDEYPVELELPDDFKLKDIVGQIYNIVFPLGVAITVIIGGVLGVKFMLGSTEEKAKIKESIVPYSIGCIAIYGAFGIWKIVITVMSAIG